MKPLPNGWIVRLSNEIYLDAKGHTVEDLGVFPQQTIDFFPEGDLFNGHAAAVLRLVEHLHAGAGSARSQPFSLPERTNLGILAHTSENPAMKPSKRWMTPWTR